MEKLTNTQEILRTHRKTLKFHSRDDHIRPEDRIIFKAMSVIPGRTTRLAVSAWFRIGAVGLGLFGVGLAIFLSVKSSPSMTAVRWLPHFMTAWADQHGRLCNFPAYALLAIPFLALAPGRWQRAGVTISLAVLVTGLEVVQIWIPSRVADKWDVFWGSSGLLASWAAVEVIVLLFRRIAVRVKNER